jgi:hypothetical protein
MAIKACRAVLTERRRLMCKQRGRQHSSLPNRHLLLETRCSNSFHVRQMLHSTSCPLSNISGSLVSVRVNEASPPLTKSQLHVYEPAGKPLGVIAIHPA